MPEVKENLITTGAMAKELGVSDTKIKKALKELNIQPVTKRGVCNYYSRSELEKIKKFLQEK